MSEWGPLIARVNNTIRSVRFIRLLSNCLSFSHRVPVAIIAAVIFGLALGFTYAPYGCVIFLFISYPAIYWLVTREQSWRQMVAVAYAFSFFYLLPTTLWISKAFSIDMRFMWLTPLAIVGIPAYMALCPTMSLALLYANRHQSDLSKLFIFTVSWVFFEYVRNVVSYGFSMNMIGYVVAFSDQLSQLASIVGAYGLSFFVVLAATMPAIIFRFFQYSQLRRALLCTLSLCCIVGVPFLYGGYRLAHNLTDYDYNTKLRIVQGGITPHELWRTRHMQTVLVERYLTLSLSEGHEHITHFIWGEGTIPFAINVDSSDLMGLVRGLPRHSLLLTGSSRVDSSTKDIFNSWIAIDNATGRIKAHYDKSHLVPFGEFLPFRKFLATVFDSDLLRELVDYTAGSMESQAVYLANTPAFYVMICYETMFMGRLLDSLSKSSAKDLRWILNLTNDGWFGTSAGPYQHLAVAKIRTIESGLPFIRSTNTGVSAIYDGYGRLLDVIPLRHSGVMDVFLPKQAAKTIIRIIYPYCTNAGVVFVLTGGLCCYFFSLLRR